jgi:hypothetical protein
MLFTRRRIQKPRPVQLFWVDAARYLGVILDTRLTWSSHIDQVRKKAAQRLGVLGPPAQEWTVYTERCSALQAAHPSHEGLRVPSLEVRRPFPCQEAAGASIQVSSRC